MAIVTKLDTPEGARRRLRLASPATLEPIGEIECMTAEDVRGALENIERDLSEAILRLRLQNIADQISELTTLQHNTNDAHNNRYYIKTVEQYKQERRKLEHTKDALSLTGKRRLEANQYGEPLA